MATRFPHLLPHERRIYAKFQANPPFHIQREVFDRRLGQGIPLNPDWPSWLRHSAQVLTQKRVDVIVETGRETWILEIKRRAGFSALGQLLGYGVLYMAEENPVQPPRLGVICESVMSDIDGVLANYGVTVFIV